MLTMKPFPKIAAALAGSVLLAALGIGASFWVVSQLNEVAGARKHTNAVMHRSDVFLSALKDAESGQRGFALTGDESYLQPYLAVRSSIKTRLEDLNQLSRMTAARDTGTALLINLPFARGKVFQAARGKPLPAWAADFDAATWGQFFLKYILVQEAVTCVIPGTDKPEYMLDNLGAARGRLPNAAQRMKMLEFYESVN
jgi:hypothetical protein